MGYVVISARIPLLANVQFSFFIVLIEVGKLSVPSLTQKNLFFTVLVPLSFCYKTCFHVQLLYVDTTVFCVILILFFLHIFNIRVDG